jgi:hypothetical protein
LIDRRYVVDRFIFVAMTDDADAYGLVAHVICCVDGLGYGPFFLMRVPGLELRTNYCLSMHPFNVPACLHVQEVRDEIHAGAKALYEKWRAEVKT